MSETTCLMITESVIPMVTFVKLRHSHINGITAGGIVVLDRI